VAVEADIDAEADDADCGAGAELLT